MHAEFLSHTYAVNVVVPTVPITIVPALRVQVAAVKVENGVTDAIVYVINSPSSSMKEFAGIV